MTVKFRSKDDGNFYLRTGNLQRNGKSITTPYYFPIVNIMTGPPYNRKRDPPVPHPFNNGGIWKFVKRELFQERKIDGFMAQILHFMEFGVSKDMLGFCKEDKRGTWLQEPIPDQLEKTGKNPFLFVDSGGYRLLYNTSLNLEAYGIKPNVENILKLQKAFGGDAVATLDYPLPPGLNDAEAQKRIDKSIDNCIDTAKLSEAVLNNDSIIYMAVHGRTREEARNSVQRLLARLKEEKLDGVPFGLAIGSLVPRSGAPNEVIDIVYGVHEGLHSVDWVNPSEVPIHAFGVSSRIIPYLAAIGVDTFDGTSYIQQAQTLRYYQPKTFQATSFLSLESLECDCKYCQIMKREGLDRTKQILKGDSFRPMKIEYDGQKIKSYVYALIALHNLQASLDQIQTIHRVAHSDDKLSELFINASADPKMRKTVAHMIKYFPEISDILWEIGYSNVRNVDRKKDTIKSQKETKPNKKHMTKEPRVEHEISLELGPEAFDISKINYTPAKKPILLILPCSQKKPYSTSPSHALIRRTLNAAGITPDRYQKVTLSGNYGPVPEEFEKEKAVEEYDFYLSFQDERRIELLVDRMRRFLIKNGAYYELIVGYSTAKSYREVMERSLDGIPNAVVLPEPLKKRKSTEFKKAENLAQLVDIMGKAAGCLPTQPTEKTPAPSSQASLM